MKYLLALLGVFTILSIGTAQNCYWQQRADYQMDIDFNVENNQFTGKQTVVYTNNSPDTLTYVFYHLYFNAFQPGSMMDVRSRTIQDPDSRVTDRISKLEEDEYGWQKIQRFLVNDQPAKTEVHGTIMKVELPSPILPNSSATFTVEFLAQVPKQIRRSGRDNKEGIRYSMTQWYPKIAEYDFMGWHAYEYVGREFHSPWGNYDVTIHIDNDYVVGGTGVLESEVQPVKSKKGKTTWHFVAENVIDFAWAADPDYTYKEVEVPNGPVVKYYYQPSEKTTPVWEKMIEEYTIPLFTEMQKQFGEYPFPTYSILQGGDGGMEYPMATLITGERKFSSLYGVISHELAHSWFQMMMASNEALYPWMDEGMTSFADAEVSKVVFHETGNPHSGAYNGYLRLVESGLNEPASQHSDHFDTNFAYGVSAYSKGQLFLSQLKYIMGEEVFNKAMMRYYDEWKFKHPTPNDFMRVLEKESDMQLQWFLRYWINTTKTIDYAIADVSHSVVEDVTVVTLENKGNLPMPVEVTIQYKDDRGDQIAYIPLNETYGSKQGNSSMNWEEKPVWNWVEPTYKLMILAPIDAIESIQIDAENQTADINRENNKFTLAKKVEQLKEIPDSEFNKKKRKNKK